MKYKVGDIVCGRYGMIEIVGYTKYRDYNGVYTSIFAPNDTGLRVGMGAGILSEEYLDDLNPRHKCPMEVQHEIQKG